jgi:Amt family ammonium transporter
MKNIIKKLCILGSFALVFLTFIDLASAEEIAKSIVPPVPAAAIFDSGNTAWMLVSTILVLMMTLPGLALFYGGMVHKESVLATMMQSFVAATVVSVLWVVYGYSFIFTEHNGFIGGFEKFMLAGVGKDTLASGTVIPESVFTMFQMTFGIIACALIFGSVATRVKFSAVIIFIVAWFTLVYVPIAHWVWGPKGMLGGVGIDGYKGLLGFGATLDFAGGTVVHINAGIAGLMAAIVLGKSRGFNSKSSSETPHPYNIVFSIIGASLLWVGWFGFNAGSAVAANGNAGMAMLTTHAATAAASLAWMAVEWQTRGKPSVIGIISGAVAGLVAVTPACGFVGLGGALIIGAVAGFICFYACSLKFKLGFDDSLDVFGVHCIGGIIGALLTGFFAIKEIGGTDGSWAQFLAQCEGVGVTLIYGAIVSYAILKIIDVIMGLRVDEETEYNGLDLAIHGNKIS